MNDDACYYGAVFNESASDHKYFLNQLISPGTGLLILLCTVSLMQIPHKLTE